jgi:adenine-specific DNA-methyltransferase
MTNFHQKIPCSGPAREALRVKGQFWTPAWLAEAMVAYVVADGAAELFDPAVGAGAFFQAARRRNENLKLRGCEVDSTVLSQSLTDGLRLDDLTKIEQRDFVLNPPAGKRCAIVANPPYIRHHRLDAQTKDQLRTFATRLMGFALDGRAGYHVYFLLRALEILKPAGRLAFILPADVCEGVFATDLWHWITTHFRLDAVVTFTPDATPFPGVDTNAVLILIQNKPPISSFQWAHCTEDSISQLQTWLQSDLAQSGSLDVKHREFAEALKTGFSRQPRTGREAQWTLGDFARVLRGVATGANEFFFLTETQANQLAIPRNFLQLAVGRTRDVIGDEITPDDVKRLDAAGRPTLLLKINGVPRELLPLKLNDYLKWGETLGLETRPLIATRRPWYKMESRVPPPILFAYLGRRHARFIRNRAGVVPLTGFLCVYPYCEDETAIEKLWQALNHPATLKNLPLVGKSYGSGAIKVEPRALERLSVPDEVVAQLELLKMHPRKPVPPKQLQLQLLATTDAIA